LPAVRVSGAACKPFVAWRAVLPGPLICFRWRAEIRALQGRTNNLLCCARARRSVPGNQRRFVKITRRKVDRQQSDFWLTACNVLLPMDNPNAPESPLYVKEYVFGDSSSCKQETWLSRERARRRGLTVRNVHSELRSISEQTTVNKSKRPSNGKQ